MKSRNALMIGLIGALLLTGCGTAADSKQAEETDEVASSSSLTETSSVAEAASEIETSSDTEDGTEENAEAESSTEEESETAEEQDPMLAIPTVSGEFSLEDCVKLGEYKGLDLTMDVEPVADEDLDSYLEYMVQPVEIDDPDAAVQEGDIVNIDYEGKLNGEPFDGGTSQGFDLEIGSGSFIPGFEDGVIGMKAGETKDLDLTFPESYVENLAGKDVVFTVTVNAIKQMPVMDDAWVQEYTGGKTSTLEEFREATRQDMEEQQKEYAEDMMKSDAWQKILDGAEVLAFPEEYLTESADAFDEYVSGEAKMYEMELEEYLEQMGMTQEDYENYRDSATRNDAKNRLVLEALIEAEGVTKDSQEFKDAAAKLEEMYGMSEQELRESYGEDSIDQYIYSDVLMDKVISYANVTEKTAGEE
ncbi:MAG: trigger factor [Eubacterium sp.]|nr:trigger factor [Eubacterium sp.]